ncbi:MAG: three component ABC system middle component [Lachnospiraceae bacterium]
MCVHIEVAYLLNPTFCGRILYSTIKTYNEILNRAFPFPLIYLVFTTRTAQTNAH